MKPERKQRKSEAEGPGRKKRTAVQRVRKAQERSGIVRGSGGRAKEGNDEDGNNARLKVGKPNASAGRAERQDKRKQGGPKSAFRPEKGEGMN